MTKSVITYIAEKNIAVGKRKSHAERIISGGRGNAEGRSVTLKECGVHIADNLVEIGSTVAKVLNK